METIRHLIETAAVAKAEVKPTAAVVDKEIDYQLQLYNDLINPTWKAWHAKWIKTNGLDSWIRQAKVARQDGKDKPRYFTWLLKRAA